MTTFLSLVKTITATIIFVSDDASCNKRLVPAEQHLVCCIYTSIFSYATYHLMSLDKCYVI